MSWLAGSSGGFGDNIFRRRFVPVGSTLAASLFVLLPIVGNGTPVVPEFALLVALAWRLLRPEIWAAHAALGFGLFNDFIAGHPLGQSMATWTMIFLACDYIDSWLGFRDFWMDWLIAAAAILFYTAAAWYIGLLMGARMEFHLFLPQIGASILAYPIIARVVLALDRWRLAR